MTRPRVAISGAVRSADGRVRTGVDVAYVHAVLAAGGLPFVLSPVMAPEHAAEFLDAMDALVLTGGADVDPALYGADPSPHLGSVDSRRDRFELAVLAEAQHRGMPVLGICRGLQLLNVALGGTLYQDLGTELPGTLDHKPGVSRQTRCHRVRLVPGSRAARVLGTEQLETNSAHHQAIRDIPPGLVATGWSDDGVVEAVESLAGDPWLLGVQWHPEEMHGDLAAPEQGLFAALVAEAKLVSALPDRA